MYPLSLGIETAVQVWRGGRSNGKNVTEYDLNYLENNTFLNAPIGLFLLMSNWTELGHMGTPRGNERLNIFY